jgi:hypothetical protein
VTDRARNHGEGRLRPPLPGRPPEGETGRDGRRLRPWRRFALDRLRGARKETR